jgi:hypothetical protein
MTYTVPKQKWPALDRGLALIPSALGDEFILGVQRDGRRC